MTMSSDMNRQTRDKNRYIKIISLVVLTVQNALLALSMRHARTQKGALFISSTAVVFTEVVKLVTSLTLVYYYEAFNVTHFFKILHSTVVKEPIDTLKVCVPAIVYVIQNNLLYVASTHLDAATAQVTYQLKILTTAIFAVTLLRRSLGIHQWIALFILLSGAVLVQLAKVTDNNRSDAVEQNRLIGMAAALAACVCSGFAGIYFEKILKGSDISVWMRNVQLSIIAIPAGIVHVLINDWDKIVKSGFFVGYNYFVVYLIFLQALGGLLVAVVVKYADNILKGFATSLAIILSCIFSYYLFDFTIDLKFILGAVLVMASVFLYGIPMKDENKQRSYQTANVVVERT